MHEGVSLPKVVGRGTCRDQTSPRTINIMLFKHLDSKAAGSREHENEPRLVGQILSERLTSGNDAFALAYRCQYFNSGKEVVAS